MGSETIPRQVSSSLSLEDKSKVLDIILNLRTYQLIGMIEARNWVEFLFPEFADFRDQDADEIFSQMASLSAGREERPGSGNKR